MPTLPKKTPVLDQIGRDLAAGLITAILVATAGGVALIAASFALYALLKDWVSPAGASALTALVFAILAALLAVIAPKVIKGRSQANIAAAGPVNRLSFDNPAVRFGADLATAIIGALAETTLRRRMEKTSLKRHR